MDETTHTLRTRSKAAYAIVYVGTRGGKPVNPPTIEGYAHTKVAADRRARRLGSRHVVAPIVAGRVTVTVPPVLPRRPLAELIAERDARRAAH